MNQQLPPKPETEILQQIEQNKKETAQLIQQANQTVNTALKTRAEELSQELNKKEAITFDMSQKAQQERVEKSEEIIKNLQDKISSPSTQEIENKKKAFEKTNQIYEQMEQDLKAKQEIKTTLQSLLEQQSQYQNETTENFKKIKENLQQKDRDIDDMYKLYDDLDERSQKLLEAFQEKYKLVSEIISQQAEQIEQKDTNLKNLETTITDNMENAYFKQKIINICAFLGISTSIALFCYLFHVIHNK